MSAERCEGSNELTIEWPSTNVLIFDCFEPILSQVSRYLYLFRVMPKAGLLLWLFHVESMSGEAESSLQPGHLQ